MAPFSIVGPFDSINFHSEYMQMLEQIIDVSIDRLVKYVHHNAQYIA